MVRHPPRTQVHVRLGAFAWARRGSQLCLALVLAAGVSGCAGKNKNGSSAHANSGQTVDDLDWKQRVAIKNAEYKRADPEQHEALNSLQPSKGPNPALDLTQIQGNKQAAPVLVTRLMSGETEANRRALAEALPTTGGDWQEPAAALIKLDADAKVRVALVQSMRYAEAPHSVEGLRLGFADEDPKVQAAAARTAGFSKQGRMLYDELHSSLFAEDWDLRAAAAQSLGKLEMQEARSGLIRALGDEHPEVRLYALVALEKIEPSGVANIPEVHQLTKDSDDRVAKEARRIVIAPPKK
ncbi:MAG: HEAT repeat domain-containing protein [Nannocystaceae bacterium]